MSSNSQDVVAGDRVLFLGQELDVISVGRFGIRVTSGTKKGENSWLIHPSSNIKKIADGVAVKMESIVRKKGGDRRTSMISDGDLYKKAIVHAQKHRMISVNSVCMACGVGKNRSRKAIDKLVANGLVEQESVKHHPSGRWRWLGS